MKISFDLRSAHIYKGTGIGTYTKNLVDNLLQIDSENTYDFFYCGDNSNNFKKHNTSINYISKKHSTFFEQIYIPYIIKKNNCSIFHIPQNGIGYKELLTSNNFNTIVTIHDLIPYIIPETVGKSYLKNFLKEMPYIVENSSGIITVSEYSKNQLCKFFSINPDKIFITPLAANKNFKPLNVEFCRKFIEKKYKIDYNFILYLGGFSKRKNVYQLIEAYEKSYKNFNKPTKLLLLGNIKNEYEILNKLICEKNLQKHVVFSGFVPEEELPFFYNACDFFAYLSKYEGFGLPPLEAMSCKKAVLTSNKTSIPEVVGNSCITVDPNNILKISELLCEISNNIILKNNLEERAYDQSKNFSWKKCSFETLKTYKTVLERNS